jgi:hypothetical protein
MAQQPLGGGCSQAPGRDTAVPRLRGGEWTVIGQAIQQLKERDQPGGLLDVHE